MPAGGYPKAYAYRKRVADADLYAALDDFKRAYPDVCQEYNLRACRIQGCAKKHEVPADMQAFSDRHQLDMRW